MRALLFECIPCAWIGQLWKWINIPFSSFFSGKFSTIFYSQPKENVRKESQSNQNSDFFNYVQELWDWSMLHQIIFANQICLCKFHSQSRNTFVNVSLLGSGRTCMAEWFVQMIKCIKWNLYIYSNPTQPVFFAYIICLKPRNDFHSNDNEWKRAFSAKNSPFMSTKCVGNLFPTLFHLLFFSPHLSIS